MILLLKCSFQPVPIAEFSQGSAPDFIGYPCRFEPNLKVGYVEPRMVVPLSARPRTSHDVSKEIHTMRVVHDP
jgi:hypothetical protein